MTRKIKPATASSGRVDEPPRSRRLASDVSVCTVSVELTVDEPGVTVVGLKVAVAPAGRPVAVKLIGLVKAPPCGATPMV